MNRKILIALVVGMSGALTITFNACSEVLNGSGQKQDDGHVKGNGDFYAGKVYIRANPGQCSDGIEAVDVAQFVTEVSAQFIRENCADLAAPRPVAAKDIVKGSDPNVVVIEGRSLNLYSANLVQNGSFESGLDGFELLLGTPTNLTADAASGSAAAVTVLSSNWTGFQQGINPSLLIAGRRYSLRASGKISPGPNPIRVAFRTNFGTAAELSFSSTTWQSQAISFQMPAGVTWSLVYIYLENDPATNQGYVDDLILSEIP
ncbi:MAG: carbohydrate binding domain-containing protein [Bdellovibrionales bacterium]